MTGWNVCIFIIYLPGRESSACLPFMCATIFCLEHVVHSYMYPPHLVKYETRSGQGFVGWEQ